MPDSIKPKALIVMATGSGTQDRDESVFGLKPFKTIAEHLSNNGYAVIRMDDRGAGESEGGDIANATTFDFAGDISAALAAADSLTGLHLSKGVFGHSEGGIIAQHIAVNDANADFIITYGAPAFRGDSVLMRQVRESFRMAGAETKFNDLYPSLRRRYDIVAGPGLQAIIESLVLAETAKTQPEIMAMPQLKERAIKEVKALCSPWMRTFLRHDPASDIAKIKIPWLALNGSIDIQVTPDNLALIASLCNSADTVELPKLNHIMQKGISGSVAEYEKITTGVDQSLLDTIVEWLDRNIAPLQQP